MKVSLKQAVLSGSKHTFILSFGFCFCLGYITCFKYLPTQCDTGFTVKNLMAFVIAIACISPLIPIHFYDKIGLLVKSIAADDGPVKMLLEAKYLYQVTMLIILGVVILFGFAIYTEPQIISTFTDLFIKTSSGCDSSTP